MRYYFLNSEGKETKFTASASTMISPGVFKLSIFNDENPHKGNEIFLTEVAGKYFISFDQIKWEKCLKLGSVKDLSFENKSFQVYRGYKPSGLATQNAGELITKMPGKVVKIQVSEGQQVNVGETLIIIEAMKMENEVKSAINGIVKKIYIKAGDAVEQGILMLEIEKN